jgi:hypothetical protein
MSIEVVVYLRREQIPTCEQWQKAIDAEGLNLQLDPSVNTLTQTGFWPTINNGQQCGFEYFFGPLDEESQKILQAIGNRNSRATFVWHSSLADGHAGSLAAAVLAKLVDGVFLDSLSGEIVLGAEALDRVQAETWDEKELKMQTAIQKWARATERRCPKCSAPCPEYRPRCFVCGFEIGRA